MNSKSREARANYGPDLDFANHLVLTLCSISYEKWASQKSNIS